MVRATQPQPGVEAGADADVRPEVPVGHLEAGQLRPVEVLPLADDEPERLAAERDERRQRRRARLVLEQERGRVVEPADGDRPLDQAHRAVVARDPPVALAHVAHQHRVRREVHRVHLGEVRVADQHVAGADERGGQHVALAGEAVPLRHQARGGGEREAREAPVLADRVEVGRERLAPALLQQPLDRHLHAHVVLALGVREPRVDLEPLVLERDHLGDLGRAHRDRRAIQLARRDHADVRAERAQPAPPRRRGCRPCRSSRSRTGRPSAAATPSPRPRRAPSARRGRGTRRCASPR